jgi:hypothetical protein
VQFIYCNGEAFEYVEPSLEHRLDVADSEAEEDGGVDPWGFLREQSGVDVILEQTEEGMACGPISATLWVGIKKSTLNVK